MFPIQFGKAEVVVYSCDGVKAEVSKDLLFDAEQLTKTVSFIVKSLDSEDERWQKLHSQWDIESIKVVPITNVFGLLPVSFRVIFKFRLTQIESSVILKVRDNDVFSRICESDNEFSRQDALKSYAEMYQREITFYKNVPTWANIPVPKMYGATSWSDDPRSHGTIVMEDVLRGGASQNPYNGLSFEQASAVMEHLAHFHASCFLNPHFEEVLKRMSPLTAYFPTTSREVAVRAVREIDDAYFQNNFDDIRKFIFHGLVETKCTKQGLPKVIVHGQLRSWNILFAKCLLGSASSRVRGFINWQHSHAGSPAEDITRLIVSAVNGEIRRQRLEELIEIYMRCLTKDLQRNGRVVPYHFKELVDAYSELYEEEVLSFFLSCAPFISSAHRLSQRANDNEMRNLTCRLRDAYEDLSHH
ncbi:hypothetical protein AB6A40_003667 [Gnathostoma spinigerum]|uniref:CHK kinase-like domain-containing protein n=1 Tax=Gnathostoma spinigerum TaxID=75299 RepID=A0ABD6EA89_9BILA